MEPQKRNLSKLEKLNKLSEGKVSNWAEEADWRIRNEWWKKYWDEIYLKYLIIKRKFKL